MPPFNHIIRFPTPSFDSELTLLIVELERLKSRVLGGSTHPYVFFQIKFVFHLLESLGSARIEGNRTTIDELVQATVAGARDTTEQLREISNIEDAMSWVERVFTLNPLTPIDESFLKELHRVTLKNLRPRSEGGEGDEMPGQFRSSSVVIVGAKHRPPTPFELPKAVDSLVLLLNEATDPRFDLLRIAIAHHRFEYIHPFRNGNGRVGRLLTYAMLLRSGFRVDKGRILNPTAVFCRDRNAYLDALARADSGTDEDILNWCQYVLTGLRREITLIDQLLDEDYLIPKILIPTIAEAAKRGNVSHEEAELLISIVKAQIVDAQMFRSYYPGRSPSSLSQIISRYKRHELIVPYPKPNSRQYCVNFTCKDLLHSLISTLEENGFIPIRREP
jgi:Fic family protein